MSNTDDENRIEIDADKAMELVRMVSAAIVAWQSKHWPEVVENDGFGYRYCGEREIVAAGLHIIEGALSSSFGIAGVYSDQDKKVYRYVVEQVREIGCSDEAADIGGCHPLGWVWNEVVHGVDLCGRPIKDQTPEPSQ